MPDDRILKTNVSLVAFYGDKSPQLANLIQQLQAYLADDELTQNKFIPYQLEQVHGTVIGCEGRKTKSGIINQWFEERRQETKYINCDGLVNYLQHQIDLPLTIRFGGYARDREYNFLSRNQHPYFRSFQLQVVEEQVIPILIGWSWNNDRITPAVDHLRRSFGQFNLLHKYHTTNNAIDNDFYLRLGTINGKLSVEAIQAISTKICNLLANRSALYTPLDQENIAFAQYQDLSLTPAKTKIVSIFGLTASELVQLYFVV